MSEVKQYADRDIIDLDEKGDYYFRHVDAMTGESLHSKSDIAAELGHRDMLIGTYRDLCVELLGALKSQADLSAVGIAFAQQGQFDEVRRLREEAITKAESILGEKNENKSSA